MPGRSRNHFLILVVVTLSGCNSLPPGEAVIVEQLAVREQVAAILSAVQDDDSLAAALPKLKQAAEQLKAIQERGAALKLPPADAQRLLAKYNRQIEEHDARMSAALTAIQTKAPRQAPNLIPILQALGYAGRPGGP